MIEDGYIAIKDGKIIKEDTMQNIKKNSLTYLTINSKDIKNIKEELNLEIIYENDNEIKCINNMQYNKLLKILSKYDINNLYIEDIPLEDLFINYYK